MNNEVKNEIKTNNKKLLSLNDFLHKQINNLNEKYTYLKNLFYNNNSKLINSIRYIKR